ncbi:MAG: hypothetical protein PHU78_02655 [Heliobacteriaceae bacterium]|nr:hypothetical protein [Heliobacteriaceae bacterium]
MSYKVTRGSLALAYHESQASFSFQNNIFLTNYKHIQPILRSQPANKVLVAIMKISAVWLERSVHMGDQTKEQQIPLGVVPSHNLGTILTIMKQWLASLRQ